MLQSTSVTRVCMCGLYPSECVRVRVFTRLVSWNAWRSCCLTCAARWMSLFQWSRTAISCCPSSQISAREPRYLRYVPVKSTRLIGSRWVSISSCNVCTQQTWPLVPYNVGASSNGQKMRHTFPLRSSGIFHLLQDSYPFNGLFSRTTNVSQHQKG